MPSSREEEPEPPPPVERDLVREHPLALVMGGGGARAAYQVGFLRALAKRFPDLEFPIITGVSAGAINAVHMASHPGPFPEAVDDLVKLWESLTPERVFRVDAGSLMLSIVRTLLQLASGGLLGTPGIRSLVDTEPLSRFLSETLQAGDGSIPGIRANLESGRLRALAISTSSYTTGRSVTWVQGQDIEGWTRPRRQAVPAPITVDHVMASAALPLFFPAVEIGGEWYGDGGIRLSAPLSPALHLGAHRVLAISTRFEVTDREARVPVTLGYPPPAQIIGSLLNAIFLDLLDQDALRVEKFNRILSHVPEQEREGMRLVDLLTLRPSRDLGELATEFEFRLPLLFRFLVRGLGTRSTRSPDVLSFLLFEPSYVNRLIEMGERDAEARWGELEAVLGTGPGDDPAAAPSGHREADPPEGEPPRGTGVESGVPPAREPAPHQPSGTARRAPSETGDA
jgi:NTE family protein